MMSLGSTAARRIGKDGATAELLKRCWLNARRPNAAVGLKASAYCAIISTIDHFDISVDD
jgi:hypothetical protein